MIIPSSTSKATAILDRHHAEPGRGAGSETNQGDRAHERTSLYRNIGLEVHKKTITYLTKNYSGQLLPGGSVEN